MADAKSARRFFVPPQDEFDLEGENFTVITSASQASAVDLEDLTVANVEGGTAIEIPVSYAELQNATEFEVQHYAEDPTEDPDDPDYNPNTDGIATTKRVVKSGMEQCSICGSPVADLAQHIVSVHAAPSPVKVKPPKAKLPPPEVAKKRPGSPLQSNQNPFGLKPRKRAYCKGKYQQIKPVLRYPCDACKHVSKTTDQLKKHMIIAHNGHKNTSWMFCGDCEYATRVEEELVNHVKHHQLFSILADDKDDDVPIDDDEDDEIPVSKTGLGNYDPNPMNCGDCPFETHYENELFEHLKMHLRKDANITVDTQEESKVKKEQIEHSVEQRTIYEEDDCLHCGLCTFSSKSKKNMLRHSNIVHGVVINDKDYQGGTTITVRQTAYHCTLCKFRGTTREELAQHRKRTIHNKYGGVTAVDPIAEAEERKARIRNNCL